MRPLFIASTLLFFCFVILACSDDASETQDGGQPDDAGTQFDPPDALGSFAVGHTSFTAIDSTRDNRSLLVDVWYPIDEADAPNLESDDVSFARYPLLGPFGLASEVAVEDFPISARDNQTLLVFSHGFGGTNTQSIPLMETLASHGFIVASPEHTGNTALNFTDDQETAASKRVADISFVIDALFERNAAPSDAFHNRFDTEQVGALGHSFGGTTSVGMTVGWAGGPADSRVKAILPIAGGVRTFEAVELATIDVPVLLLGGTLDESAILNNNFGFAEMTNAAALYKVEMIDATHTHFANVCAIGDYLISIEIEMDAWSGIGAGGLLGPYAATCSPDSFPIAEAIRLQNLYVVSFFRRHLLGETAYNEFLTTAYAQANESAITFVTN